MFLRLFQNRDKRAAVAVTVEVLAFRGLIQADNTGVRVLACHHRRHCPGTVRGDVIGR